MDFSLTSRDAQSEARLGQLKLPPLATERMPRGFPVDAQAKLRQIDTPCFMPVGTLATIKGVMPKDLAESGTRQILCNTYHLMKRPGEQRVAEMGGLHRFMNWPGGIITDSGGFQVYSLAKFRQVDSAGVTFQHHVDGEKLRLDPQTALEVQKQLGSDIAMVLDECVALPASRDAIAGAVGRTLEWARQSRKVWQSWEGRGPQVFAISQGGLEVDLRRECNQALVEMDFPGYALGGFSVGEPQEKAQAVVAQFMGDFPADKPRYLMGVGKPADLVRYVGLGIDLFDCVLPTRNARNGQLFTRSGPLVISHARYAADDRPIEEDCECPACRNYSRAYLRHLYIAGEILASVLNTLHNLAFYQRLMAEMRRAIREKNFRVYEQRFFELQGQGDFA